MYESNRLGGVTRLSLLGARNHMNHPRIIVDSEDNKKLPVSIFFYIQLDQRFNGL